MSPAASGLLDALLLGPSEGEQAWRSWRAGVDLENLDSDCVALLPLLSGRLPAWTAEDDADPERDKFLGICKRGWALNQLLYREVAEVWKLLEQAGAHPVSIAGNAAWALLYLEENALRPIPSLEILIRREHAVPGKQALCEAGWFLEPDMPEPAGRVLDQYRGLWFRSSSGVALFLAWRLKDVSPELAVQNEQLPLRRSIDLHGVPVDVLATEELLCEALTRNPDAAVSWRCDAIVLLRNRTVDWRRFAEICHDVAAADRWAQLRSGGVASIPSDVPGPPSAPPGRVRTRVNRLYVDYRQVAWERGETRSVPGFVQYVLRRATRVAGSSVTGRNQDLTVIDASGGREPSSYSRYRTLFFFLTIRDVRLRYRKTWRGVLWALLQPLLPMLILAAVFSGVLRPELQDIPYWLFVLAGLAPWNFFANAVSYSSVTFVNNLGLLNKVYFPRAILPAASVSAFLLDLLVSSCAMVALAWWRGHPPTLHLLLLFPAILAATLVAGATGLAAASLNALYKDLKPLVPFLIQVAMYATPVLYPRSMLPAKLLPLVWLNPMTGVVEAFRSSLFGTRLDWTGEMVSACAFLVVAAGAAFLFGKVEADLAERV